jgi:predicted Zn-dependent protease
LIQPNSPEAQLASAKAHLALKEFPDAAAQLENVAKVQPNAEVYELLSEAYGGMGKDALAKDAAAKAARARQNQRSN